MKQLVGPLPLSSICLALKIIEIDLLFQTHIMAEKFSLTFVHVLRQHVDGGHGRVRSLRRGSVKGNYAGEKGDENTQARPVADSNNELTQRGVPRISLFLS